MPPKSARKGPAPGPRRATRGGRGGGGAATAAKFSTQGAKSEEPAVEVREEPGSETEPLNLEPAANQVSVDEKGSAEKVETTHIEAVEKPSAAPPVEKANVDLDAVDSEDEDVKEPIEREDRGERLELDVDPEYENEDAGVDYYERDLEPDDVQEEDPHEGVEYGEEGDVIEEDEADMVEEELEDIEEDVEGEEYVEEEEEVDVVDEEESHDVVKEHRKRKEFEVFIGGLDRDATEEDLREVFGVAGKITEVRLMMNPVTKKNKGFAFLRYATVEEAKRAVSELKDAMVRGRKCGVAPSHDNDTLFVGNISKSWTKEHLKVKLKSYGVENFDELILVEDKNNEGMNRGYALLEFSSRSEAMDAYRRLQKRDVVFGLDRSAKVSFSDSYPEIDDEIMAQVKIVFIDGLPASWDEDRVKRCLKKYGHIEKVELARNMPSAKRKDFGFVTFETHDMAVACVEGLNDSELGEGDRKVKVRARLSRPLQKPRTRHSFRGNFKIGSSSLGGRRFGYNRPPPPRRLPPTRAPQIVISRLPPSRFHVVRRPAGLRERLHSPLAVSDRARRLPAADRSFDRRPPPPVYPKGSVRREFSRRDELPISRSRAAVEYVSRYPEDRLERRISYRDEYSPRESAYSDVGPRSVSRVLERRAYADDSYTGKIERSLPTYREGRNRDYEPISGSKRSYADIDDAPHRYHDLGIRQTIKARVDYEGASSRYSDAYGDRLKRSHDRYVSSNSVPDQDNIYGRRHGGSVSNSETGGAYSSNLRSAYISRGSDVGGGTSYGSLYSGRGVGSGGYFSGSGSGNYY